MSGARLLTAHGPGGVAVIEVRGADTLARLAALAGGRTARAGEVRLVRLTRPSAERGLVDGMPASTEDLDEALLVGGGHRAGGPSVELHLHGSPPLVDEVLQLLGGDAAHAARATTFEARAEVQLAEVPTELGARILVDQAHGALRRALLALVPLTPERRSARLAALVARTAALRALFVPVRVVLVGPVNAGKSTLFNLLAGEERAVVSPEPGTTRDAIGADLSLGPYALRLVDTAGAREVHGAGDADVERAGQAVARTLVESADVVLRLVRAGEARYIERDAGRRSVSLWTCAELVHGPDPAAWPPDAIGVTVAPAATRARVEAVLRAALGLPGDPDWKRGEALFTDEALRVAAEGVAAAGACDDPALARLRAQLDT